jgi:hypothetical protein
LTQFILNYREGINNFTAFDSCSVHFIQSCGVCHGYYLQLLTKVPEVLLRLAVVADSEPHIEDSGSGFVTFVDAQ